MGRVITLRRDFEEAERHLAHALDPAAFLL